MRELTSDGRLAVFTGRTSRRGFLRFAGGVVALPFLPAVLPSTADASTEGNAFRRAVFMVNDHGGHNLDADPVNVSYAETGANVRVGDLSAGELGPVYGSAFQQLRSKLTVIRGLDSTATAKHSISSSLMASEHIYDESDGGVGKRDERTATARDSIDTVLGRSSKVYPTPPPIRVLRLSPYGSPNHTHCFENHHSVSAIDDEGAARDLVLSKIVAPDDGEEPTVDLAMVRRRAVMERALLAIDETRRNPALGAADRVHLESYQSVLASLRDDISVDPASAATLNGFACGDFSPDAEDQAQRMAQVMVAALACGVTKVAYMRYDSEHYYVHRVNQEENRVAHRNYLRDRALPICSYTMELMDQIPESNGQTLLDNSGVLITSALGTSRPHLCLNTRVLVGGSLNGALETGLAVDYMDRRHTPIRDGGNEPGIYAGRYYNSLLVTLMQGFGLTPEDYETNPGEGFGTYECRDQGFCDFIQANESFGSIHRKFFDHYQRVVSSGYPRNTPLREILRSA